MIFKVVAVPHRRAAAPHFLVHRLHRFSLSVMVRIVIFLQHYFALFKQNSAGARLLSSHSVSSLLYVINTTTVKMSAAGNGEDDRCDADHVSVIINVLLTSNYTLYTRAIRK